MRKLRVVQAAPLMTRRLTKKFAIPRTKQGQVPPFVTPKICNRLNKLAPLTVQPATECGYFATYGSLAIPVS